MRAMTSIAGVALTVSLGSVGFAGCGGGTELPPAVAAKIGDTVILESDVENYLDGIYASQGGTAKSFGPPAYRSCIAAWRAVESSQQQRQADDFVRRSPIEQCKTEYEVERAQAVDSLMRANWLARESKRLRIPLAAARAESVEHDQLNRSPTATYAVTHAHASARQEILLQAIAVSEADVARYANENPEVFSDSEKRVVRIIQTRTRGQAERARAAVESGGHWKAVAARYARVSEAPTWTGRKTVEKAKAPEDAFGKAIFAVKRNTVTGPVENLNGWFIFEVEDIRPGSKRVPERLRDTIVTTIRAKRLEQRLHSHYAPLTTCAKEYRVPEARSCL